MGIATVIPASTFEELQLDAGVLLNNFDPERSSSPISDSDIICATTGGITVSCVPTYSDFGADIDNCPNNTKELKHLDAWDCKITTTAVSISEDMFRLALGAASPSSVGSGSGRKYVPNKNLNVSTDYQDVWWVGDLADGSLVAAKLINALSTGGFSLKTTKNNKGQLSIELTGHVSINAQDTMPMEFYLITA